MRRFAAAFAVLVGATLVVFTFTEHLASRSSDAQTIADHYRPLMSAQGLAGLHNGFDTLKAAGTQLDDAALPRLRDVMGMPQAQFDALVTTQMPHIKAFNDQAPTVVGLVGPVIDKMEAERADYALAAQIPTSFLGLSSAPWLFLGIGGLLLVIGAFGLVKPRRLVSFALVVVGLGIVLAPLVIGIPGKIDAAVRVTQVGAIGLAPTTGQKAVAATSLFDGMASDVTNKLEPMLASELHLSPAEGERTFAADFPTLATFSTNWESSISAQSHALSSSQVALAPIFANANKIPLRPIPWLFIGPGIALTLLGAASLVPVRRRVHAPVPALSVDP